MNAEARTTLGELLRKGVVWRGTADGRTQTAVVSSGFSSLDEQMGGGWPRGALTEIFSQQGLGFSLLLPLLAELSRQQQWLTWVNPPHVPYAPALAARQVDTARVLLVKVREAEQSLWAAEQALRSGNCSLVLLWVDRVSAVRIRRLQLAAEESNCMGILFRPLQQRRQASMAALRLQILPAANGLEVRVLKRRGGWGGKPLMIQRMDFLRGSGD
ncbi:MAG TPA: translesion DNA synthesis-associated protein ImuA [Chromatiaceae bacterium]|nr:translesion DNA synthesis-associated protein ImuA [Chromatiaceae bacterium]